MIALIDSLHANSQRSHHHFPQVDTRGGTMLSIFGRDRLREGYHESRICSTDTCPESYITQYDSIRRVSTLCTRSASTSDSRERTISKCRFSGVRFRVSPFGLPVSGFGFHQPQRGSCPGFSGVSQPLVATPRVCLTPIRFRSTYNL